MMKNTKKFLFELFFLICISLICIIYFTVPQQYVRLENSIKHVKIIKELILR